MESLSSRATVALTTLALFMGCGSSAGPTDKDPNAPDDPPSFDTSNEIIEAPFVPAGFMVWGEFGWNAEEGQFVDVISGGATLPPLLAVIPYELDYLTTLNSSFACQIIWEMDTDTLNASLTKSAPWVQDQVWFGYEALEDVTPITDCANWDPSIWEGDPIDMFSRFDWGVGVSAINSAVQAELDAAVVAGSLTEEDAARFFGGGAWSDHFVGISEEANVDGFVDSGIGNALLIDSTNALAIDAKGATIPLTGEDVEAGDPIASGFYTIQTLFPIDWAQ